MSPCPELVRSHSKTNQAGLVEKIEVFAEILLEPPSPKGEGFLLHRSPYGAAPQAFIPVVPTALKFSALLWSRCISRPHAHL